MPPSGTLALYFCDKYNLVNKMEHLRKNLSIGAQRPGRLADKIFMDELNLSITCGRRLSNTQIRRMTQRYTKLVMKLVAKGANAHYAKRYAVLTVMGQGCYDYRRIMAEVYALHRHYGNYDNAADSMAYYCALSFVNGLPDGLLEGCAYYDKPWQQKYIRKLYSRACIISDSSAHIPPKDGNSSSQQD